MTMFTSVFMIHKTCQGVFCFQMNCALSHTKPNGGKYLTIIIKTKIQLFDEIAIQVLLTYTKSTVQLLL